MAQKDILLVWIAWCGKGTQARALEEHFGESIQYFEPGSILRAFTSNDNIIGDYAKSFTNAGKLLPESFMQHILELVFDSVHPDTRLLIDGFPRLYAQKALFDTTMQAHGRDFMVIHLSVPDDIVRQRLSHRRICSSCGTTYSLTATPWITQCPTDGTLLTTRADDLSDDAVTERLDLFHKETMPIIDGYAAEGKVVTVDGTQSIEKITHDILEKLE